MTDALRIGLAGLGTVGGEVARRLMQHGGTLAQRGGRQVVLRRVSARDRNRNRGIGLSAAAWEADPLALAQADDIDVVVELIGGAEGVARGLVEAALRGGKAVVTANKALLAHHGAELAALADKKGAALKFEGAIAGGIPIVKALRENLVAYDIRAVHGILNGTCNYILTQMEATGRDFAGVLAEAQRLGYAEADPTLDVGGGDTAHKLALLAALAFGTMPDLDNVSVTGIAAITPEDISFAREFGHRIKLLGVARRTPAGIEQRVEPSMVRMGTPLADVDGSFNAVVADAAEAGPYFFEGRGAGAAPTASAVIADILDIARCAQGPAFGVPAGALKRLTPAPSDARLSPYYLRFRVLDVPGVLAEISRHLAEHEVSIESMIQRGRSPGEPVAIVMITHESRAFAVRRALKAISASDKVLAAPCMIPIEAV